MSQDRESAGVSPAFRPSSFRWNLVADDDADFLWEKKIVPWCWTNRAAKQPCASRHVEASVLCDWSGPLLRHACCTLHQHPYQAIAIFHNYDSPMWVWISRRNIYIHRSLYVAMRNCIYGLKKYLGFGVFFQNMLQTTALKYMHIYSSLLIPARAWFNKSWC